LKLSYSCNKSWKFPNPDKEKNRQVPHFTTGELLVIAKGTKKLRAYPSKDFIAPQPLLGNFNYSILFRKKAVEKLQPKKLAQAGPLAMLP